MANQVRRLGRNVLRWTASSAGQTLVEYALIIALISLAVLALSAMAFGTNGIINDISDRFNEAIGL